MPKKPSISNNRLVLAVIVNAGIIAVALLLGALIISSSFSKTPEDYSSSDSLSTSSNSLATGAGVLAPVYLDPGEKFSFGFVFPSTHGEKDIDQFRIDQCQIGWDNDTSFRHYPYSEVSAKVNYFEGTYNVVASEDITNTYRETGDDYYKTLDYNYESVTFNFGDGLDLSEHTSATRIVIEFNLTYSQAAAGEQIYQLYPACTLVDKSTGEVSILPRYLALNTIIRNVSSSSSTTSSATPSSTSSNSSTTSSASTSVGSLDSVTMYRYYNESKGVHFYTDNKATMERFPDYSYEKEAFRVFPKANAESYISNPDIVPVYRFYNPETGAHFYTANESQAARVRDNYSPPFIDEGIKFYVYRAGSGFGTELRKFFNPSTGAHFFTAFENEMNALTNDSRFNTTFNNEGEAFRVIPL